MPISINHQTEDEAVNKTLERVKYLVSEEPNIITIKSSVYAALSQKLKIYNHIEIKIPYSSSCQQGNFKSKFDEAIKKTADNIGKCTTTP